MVSKDLEAWHKAWPAARTNGFFSHRCDDPRRPALPLGQSAAAIPSDLDDISAIRKTSKDS